MPEPSIDELANMRPEDNPSLREHIKPDVWYHVRYGFKIEADGTTKLLGEMSIEEASPQ